MSSIIFYDCLLTLLDYNNKAFTNNSATYIIYLHHNKRKCPQSLSTRQS